jgi:hypothetical protein
LISLFNIILSANGDYELKLYDSILPKIYTKNIISVYIQDSEIKTLLQKSRHFKITNRCENAELIIGKYPDMLDYDCQNIPIFATSYRSYKNIQNAIGAFYWRKGRPQVKFNLNTIERYNLYLPQNLKKYAQ